jgi:AraC-like DNA-binding protein
MPSPALPFSPWILAAGDGERPFAWRKPRRILPFHLVVCCRTGIETVHLDDGDLPVPAGASYLIPAGTPHALSSPGNHPVFVHAELTWHAGRGSNGWERFPVPPMLGADPASRQPSPADVLGAALPIMVPTALAARFRATLPGIVRRWLAGGVHERAAAGLDLGALLLAWAAWQHDRGPAGGDPAARLARAEAAVRADPAGASLAVMAAAAGLGRSRFCALWRQRRDGTPAAHLRAVRLALADELLSETDLGLAAIAARCGYADAPSFIRAFRTARGCTPQAWRRQR